jgi:hypothetical protein
MRKSSAIPKFWLAALLAVIAVVAVGCGQETVTVPLVVSTIPANGASGVTINTPISATFSTAMNPGSISSSTFTLATAAGAAVSGSVSYTGETASFTPAALLAYGTQYTATITTGATSRGGAHLLSNYVWSFTTITPPPAVVSTIPANGAINVPVGQVLSATFSAGMNPASISASSFTVTSAGGPVAGVVTYSGVTATFTPAAGLANATLYTATITTGATSMAGTPLPSNYVWSFTTITSPPVVIATVPVNGATGVAMDQIVSATFNDAMNCTSIASPASTFRLSAPGGTAVTGTAACAGATATFKAANPLATNTLYTATITTAAQSVAGTPMAANYVWTFRTVPAAAAPAVISTVPANLAVGVPTNQAVSATFSVAMNPATIGAATFTVTGPGAVAVSGAATYVPAGSVATFTPTIALAPNTLYTATITTGAQDLQGTALAANYTWSFTTAAGPILVAPVVTSTIPANLANGVPLNQVVSATFSQPMNPATINNSTFSMTGPGATPVLGLVAYSGVSNSLTFTPAANLPPSTTFTATITTGVKNVAGTTMASTYVWTFATGTAVKATQPQIVSTNPANTAINVPLNQTVSATFTESMNPLTITTGTFQVTGPGGTLISGTVSYDAINFIGTFTPRDLLITSTTYTAVVTNGATDMAGDPLGTTGAPNPWTFTTGTTTEAPPVVLGPTIALFGAFGGNAGITNQGINTVINGDLGTTGVSTLITGFHDMTVVVAGVPQCIYTETPLNVGVVNGVIDTAPPPPTVGCPNEGTAVTSAVAAQAALEALNAYNTLAGIPNGLDVSVCPGCGGGSAGELGNRTLAAGVYKAAPGSFAITQGDLTLDAKGDPNASWVFQMATTLTVGTPSVHRNILLVNGAQAKNVFWQVGSAATLNGVLGGGTVEGTVIAQSGVSVSTAGVNAITTLNGRAIVLTGPVTVVNTVINVPAP